MDRAEIIKDQSGQTLTFIAREGRPSATPTVGIKDKGGTILSAAADTNVAIKTTDTTLTAAAAIGDETVTLDAVTGLELGGSYRMVNAINQVEWISVKGWDTSSKVVTLRSPLMYSFATDRGGSDYGDFQSTEFTYTLQTADYDTLRELNVATATYTVDNVVHRIRRAFDCVITPLDNPLTVSRMYQRWPDLARQEHDERRGEDYLGQREDAWSTIKRRIRQQSTETRERWGKRKKWRPAMIVDISDFFEAAMAQLRLVLHLEGIAVDRDRPTREQLLDAVSEELTLAMKTVSWLDLTEDESISEGEEVRLELDLVR